MYIENSRELRTLNALGHEWVAIVAAMLVMLLGYKLIAEQIREI